MTAGPLFAALEPPRECSGCVHLNPSRDRPGEGACARAGWRALAAAVCDQWFGLEQLQAGLYGRGSAA